MNFQSSCKIITNQSLWHYSPESQFLQKGPSRFSNSSTKPLVGKHSRGWLDLRLRPAEAAPTAVESRWSIPIAGSTQGRGQLHRKLPQEAHPHARMAMTAAARCWCGFGLHGPGECAQEEEQGKADAVVLSLACNRIQQRESAAWPRALELGHGGRERAHGERWGEELGVGRRVFLEFHYLECGAGHAAESRARGNSGGARRPCAATTSASGRTGGGHRCGYGGAQVWASYGPIWSMGPKRSFLYSARSTFFIKRPRSFEQWISS